MCHSLDSRGLKDVIKDPFETMRLLFTTLTQKQLRRAIESLETVVQIRDEDFPALHSLTWDMVRALDRAGMTIGSHTQTHALLTLENPKRMANQIVGLPADVAGKTRQARVAFCLSGRAIQSFRRVLCRGRRLPVRVHHLSPSGRALSVADHPAENLVGEFLAGSVRGLLEHPHALSRSLDFRSLPVAANRTIATARTEEARLRCTRSKSVSPPSHPP